MLGEYFIQTLHRKEQAEEDLYFAQRDRELIAKLRSQRSEPPSDSGTGSHPEKTSAAQSADSRT